MLQLLSNSFVDEALKQKQNKNAEFHNWANMIVASLIICIVQEKHN